jgi:hypothetical protein
MNVMPESFRANMILSSTIRNVYFAKAKSYSSLKLFLLSFYIKIKRILVTDRGKPARIIILLGLGSNTITESLAVYHNR